MKFKIIAKNQQTIDALNDQIEQQNNESWIKRKAMSKVASLDFVKDNEFCLTMTGLGDSRKIRKMMINGLQTKNGGILGKYGLKPKEDYEVE